MRIHKIYIALIIMSMGIPMSSQAYDFNTVHPEINSHAVSQANLDYILKNRFGFSNGTTTVLNEREIGQWVAYGGRQEDQPERRGLHHFFDPLETWDDAGLFNFDSSLLWATQSQDMDGGSHSWIDARNFFYSGLTATTKAEKETNLAESFRAIGHVMHLVADLSVPAHVRNDPHPSEVYYRDPDPYETWTEYEEAHHPGLLIYTGPDSNYDTSIFGRAVNLEEYPFPISALWDQDRYDETNPEETWSDQQVGLAEFTNVNFFSSDTIELNTLLADYTHPALWDTNASDLDFAHPEVIPSEDGKSDNKIYVKRRVNGVDEYNLYAACYWTSDCFEKGHVEHSTPVLDDVVHRDYAAQLIPRAVGYSANLLNHFFRGELEITASNSFLYGIIDGSIEPHQFTQIRAKVRNITPDNEILNGTLVAIAKYRKRTDYQPDLSTDPPIEISREEEFSYSVSAPIVIGALSSTIPEEYIFDFSEVPIPAGVTDLYLQVVFKGTLGNEKDIAVAVGTKDLNEPMHVCTFNSTDRVYINDYDVTGLNYGILRTGYQILRNETLFAAFDFDGDGILNEISEGEIYIYPHTMTRQMGFFPANGVFSIYQVTFADLPAGQYGRVIILTDAPSFNMQIHTVSSDPPINCAPQFTISAATAQDDINGELIPTLVDCFREINSHQWSAYAHYLGNVEGISTAAWPPLGSPLPYPAIEINP